MIDTLQALPGLSRTWLAEVARTDPELFEQLAPDLLIGPGSGGGGGAFPAGLDAVLAALDLRGKEIGAFRFAPGGKGSAAEQVGGFDRRMRECFDAPPALVFVGEYGAGTVFVSRQGVGIDDPRGVPPGSRLVAPDFAGFVLVQANAYDAFKAHIVRHADTAAYRARQADTAGAPRFAAVDVAAIFEAQLKA